MKEENRHVVRGEVFGVSVDFEHRTEKVGDEIRLSISAVMPAVRFNPMTGVLYVFPPPLIDPPVTEREMAAMRLAGWL